MKAIEATAQRTSGIRFVVVLALLGLLPAGARAADKEQPGKAMYLKYCSACHGSSGKGDGVVSGLLRPPPPDLTLIAKRAGGKFPFMKIAQAIDGTNTVRAHGDSGMPVWGEIFREEASSGLIAPGAEVRGKVAAITEYLRSIQAK